MFVYVFLFYLNVHLLQCEFVSWHTRVACSQQEKRALIGGRLSPVLLFYCSSSHWVQRSLQCLFKAWAAKRRGIPPLPAGTWNLHRRHLSRREAISPAGRPVGGPGQTPPPLCVSTCKFKQITGDGLTLRRKQRETVITGFWPCLFTQRTEDSYFSLRYVAVFFHDIFWKIMAPEQHLFV